MLRVGLTGGLGSGKSLAAGMFSDLGATVLSSDEIGRSLMEPGQAVYQAILHSFGGQVVAEDGSLDRRTLAKLAFQQGRGEELSRIVHPAVVAEEERRTREAFDRDPEAVVLVESALIFEAERSGTAPGWKQRFDRLILVTAPEKLKVERFVSRALAAGADIAVGADITAGADIAVGANIDDRRPALQADARARLAAQIPDREKAPLCDYVILNAGPPEEMRSTVHGIYLRLKAESRSRIGG